MAASLKRVCWDACAWIALIQREKIRDEKGVVTEDRDTMCRTVWTAAHKDKTTEIVTSSLSLVEVCKSPEVVAEGESKISAFFEHPHIEMVNVDRFVGERARELMLMGYSKLKPPDATHVATAALSNVDEMHTFDGKLLDLDGRIIKANGSKMRICKPDAGPSIPLFSPTAGPLLEIEDHDSAVDGPVQEPVSIPPAQAHSGQPAEKTSGAVAATRPLAEPTSDLLPPVSSRAAPVAEVPSGETKH